MGFKALKIGVDVDGVIAAHHAAWLGRYNAKHGTLFTEHDLTQWEFWKDLGCEKDAILSLYTADIYESEVKPIEGAVQAVRDIVKLGHEVYFVTSCYSEVEWHAKMAWLRQFGLNPDYCYGVGAWSGFAKKADVPVDWLIDDHIGNLQDFPGYRVLVTQPHNRNHIFCGKRVKHLRDVVPLLRYPSTNETFTPLASLVMQENKLTDNVDYGILNQQSAQNQLISPVVRQFATGATRDVDTDKLDYEAFLSPAVLERYAQFMHKNRFQKDGSMRAGDNWQKGIPTEAYMKSLLRHVFTVWLAYRRGQPLPQEEVCAILFNTSGLLYEDLKKPTT